jgi:hypothetical protein
MPALDQNQHEIVSTQLRGLLSLLRSQYLSYQTSHWQVVGNTAYGNHLLFQRLYEAVQAEIDGLAEKMVAYLGVEAVSLPDQVDLIGGWVARWSSVTGDHHARGLQSEVDAQAMFRKAYDTIKSVKAMTLGLDDFLMATANAHDTNAYLLQQVLNAHPSRVASLVRRRFGQDSGAPSAEKDFFPNPKFRETHQFADSKALTNIPAVAQKAAPILDVSKSEATSGVSKTPPTTKEILREPAGKELGTLNRVLLETEDKDIAKDKGRRASGTLANWTFISPDGKWTHIRKEEAK